jgi:hypothetical protein
LRLSHATRRRASAAERRPGTGVDKAGGRVRGADTTIECRRERTIVRRPAEAEANSNFDLRRWIETANWERNEGPRDAARS